MRLMIRIMNKARGYPVGTIRTWKGKRFKKNPQGKWVQQGGGDAKLDRFTKEAVSAIRGTKELDEIKMVTQKELDGVTIEARKLKFMNDTPGNREKRERAESRKAELETKLDNVYKKEELIQKKIKDLIEFGGSGVLVQVSVAEAKKNYQRQKKLANETGNKYHLNRAREDRETLQLYKKYGDAMAPIIEAKVYMEERGKARERIPMLEYQAGMASSDNERNRYQNEVEYLKTLVSEADKNLTKIKSDKTVGAEVRKIEAARDIKRYQEEYNMGKISLKQGEKYRAVLEENPDAADTDNKYLVEKLLGEGREITQRVSPLLAQARKDYAKAKEDIETMR